MLMTKYSTVLLQRARAAMNQQSMADTSWDASQSAIPLSGCVNQMVSAFCHNFLICGSWRHHIKLCNWMRRSWICDSKRVTNARWSKSTAVLDAQHIWAVPCSAHPCGILVANPKWAFGTDVNHMPCLVLPDKPQLRFGTTVRYKL